jgi:hypothetical protein
VSSKVVWRLAFKGVSVKQHPRVEASRSTDVQIMRDMFSVKDIIVLSIVIELKWGSRHGVNALIDSILRDRLFHICSTTGRSISTSNH